MIPWRTGAASALLLLCAAACVPDHPPNAIGSVELERATPVMGTLLRIRAQAADSATARAALRSATRAVLRVDSLMSTYKTDSELSALARSAGSGTWTALSPETVEVLAASLDWARRSGGAFDPTVEPLMEAWGFRDGAPRRPAAAELARARADVGWDGVELDLGQARARLLRGGGKLDFGAIAKGYALDRAVAALRAAGSAAGMVDLGGNVSVFGSPPSGQDDWVLGIRHPRSTGDLMGTIAVRAGSISTSGDYEQMFEADGVRYGHIMDPRQGAPARGVVAVTVAAADGMTADALSTLLFVLGPEAGRAFLVREIPDGSVTAAWVNDPGRRALSPEDVVMVGDGARIELDLLPPPR